MNTDIYDKIIDINNIRCTKVILLSFIDIHNFRNIVNNIVNLIIFEYLFVGIDNNNNIKLKLNINEQIYRLK